MRKKESPAPFGARPARALRPFATTEDLARSIQALDATLSEVLVLLYHVVQANDSLLEELRQHRPPAPRSRAAKPLLFAVRDGKAGR